MEWNRITRIESTRYHNGTEFNSVQENVIQLRNQSNYYQIVITSQRRPNTTGRRLHSTPEHGTHKHKCTCRHIGRKLPYKAPHCCSCRDKPHLPRRLSSALAEHGDNKEVKAFCNCANLGLDCLFRTITMSIMILN